MSNLLLAAIIGIPLAWHLGLTAFAYYDAPRVGLEPRSKWVAIVFLIPLIGFFIYIFERSELDYDPDEDPYKGHNFNIHPSRADDAPVRSRGDDRPDPDDADWDGTGGADSTDDEEWGNRRSE
ncbi:hypothetical protein RBH26_17980 [Natronolimnohabitans sp. A-GB9]|uniref:hypothetical protein n=1 Tax=Natronolimnohabitans sp. A-GB9 TaxID=3069757 RepID=UPI0027AE5AA3|nr:hypothetical protein [Natronolimnohabitans sp. A-GB9]MDQ2052360.1 hypothetical protein [Natronolimnohabitans sp. A-GB9]